MKRISGPVEALGRDGQHTARVIGRVAVWNDRPRAVMRRHGIHLQVAQTDPGYLDVVGRSDDVLATLAAP